MMITVTQSACKRIAQINRENQADQRLRIAVQGGGCSGFQYTFLMDDVVNSDDHVFESNGSKVVVDEVSLELIQGSILDFQEDLAASMFVIKNPVAKSGCGCGNSFSI